MPVKIIHDPEGFSADNCTLDRSRELHAEGECFACDGSPEREQEECDTMRCRSCGAPDDGGLCPKCENA